VAQLSSAFVKLIHLNDLLDAVTFTLLTNQRPRKCDMTERKKERKTYRHLDIMMAYALRAAAVKIFQTFPQTLPFSLSGILH